MLQQFLCRVCATSDAACVLMDIFEKHGAEHSVADILLELASVVVSIVKQQMYMNFNRIFFY